MSIVLRGLFALILPMLCLPAAAAPALAAPAAAPAAVGPGGLRFDPAVEPRPLGGDRFHFAGADWDVLPGVVFSLVPGAVAPEGAVHLGGPSWRLPAADAADALRKARLLGADFAANGVEHVFPDVALPKTPAQVDGVSFDDPDYGGQWYLELLGMEQLYAVSEGDPAVRVAVIDSGIDIGHPDLADAVVEPYDAFADDEDPSPDPGDSCAGSSTAICDVHGTAVSGVVLARAHNGAGIVGLCPRCTLVPIRLLGDGVGAMSADIAAFEHAIAADVGVINNSWGYTRPVSAPAPLAAVIRRAQTEPRGGKGALVVFAAGNDDRELRDDELTGLDGVICVSATDRYGAPTNYTNSGDSVDLAAPSATVTIAPEGGSTETFGGTSAAAPVVSGVAAWALSVKPELTAVELGALLVETAAPNALVTRDAAGHHAVYGYGQIDPPAVLAALEAGGGPGGADTGADGTGASEEGGAAPGKGGGGGCFTARGAPRAFFAAGVAALLCLGRRRLGGPSARGGS
ncbi:MAG: S8 family serine peptidase [Deltaproteobacteria bacterium]|nr:S8 family serine peptidase [Deltaproteobacteria bacterium]